MAVTCRLSGAWSRWPPGGGASDPLGSAAVTDHERSLVTPQSFPGRFSPLRSFPETYEPLAVVGGVALARAGLFAPGSGSPVRGGLVVGIDDLFVAPMRRFAAQIRDGFGNDASPMSFIESHPSTAASFLGILFGLGEYQTTTARGALTGGHALRHATDLIGTARLARALVVSAGPGDPGSRVVTALCLDASGDGTRGLEVDIDLAVERGARAGTRDSVPAPAARRDPLAAIADWAAASPEARANTSTRTRTRTRTRTFAVTDDDEVSGERLTIRVTEPS